jgi:hypothetical protein
VLLGDLAEGAYAASVGAGMVHATNVPGGVVTGETLLQRSAFGKK